MRTWIFVSSLPVVVQAFSPQPLPLALEAATPFRCCGRVRTRSEGVLSLRAATADADADDAGWGEDSSEVTVKKKGTRNFVRYEDGRDALPYDVFVSTPPRRKLGTLKLDPQLNCGDIIQHRSSSFVIRSVSNHYRFQAGRFVMYRKAAESTELLRAAAERVAARLISDHNVAAAEAALEALRVESYERKV
ncbi:unnamed protein product [Phaeothamnion confervicola]